MTRIGTVGQAHGVKGAEEKVARFVAGEEASGSVSSVRRRGEPDDQQASPRISKRRKGTRPVGLAAESPGRLLRNLVAPRDQPRTAAAGDDLALDPPKGLFNFRFGILDFGFGRAIPSNPKSETQNPE